MSLEFFKAGRAEVAEQVQEIIKREQEKYTSGVYRYENDWKHNAILDIKELCKTILTKKEV